MYGNIISKFFNNKKTEKNINYKEDTESSAVLLAITHRREKQIEEEMINMWKDNKQVISLERIELRQFYDSLWKVKVLIDGTFVETKLTRRDDETLQSLFNDLNKVETISEIYALDEKEKIYYD